MLTLLEQQVLGVLALRPQWVSLSMSQIAENVRSDPSAVYPVIVGLLDRRLLQHDRARAAAFMLTELGSAEYGRALAAVQETQEFDPDPIEQVDPECIVIQDLLDLAEHWDQMGASREAAQTVRDAIRIVQQGWVCTTPGHAGACQEYRECPGEMSHIRVGCSEGA